MSEEDIKLRFVTPALLEKGKWSKEQVRMNVLHGRQDYDCGEDC